MWISGWHIDGFGHFRDEDVRALPQGLVVFEGPNEAGKSTLLAFLRAILFGGPADGSEPHYPPLRGGVHGGRVFLETPDGTVTIARRRGARPPPPGRRPGGAARRAGGRR
ncbi:MAG: AAA family ATPase, partial [Gemmatimonadetes bacterium]|nr:AAA family ATPase [Gemmatimonadota bacterium]